MRHLPLGVIGHIAYRNFRFFIGTLPGCHGTHGTNVINATNRCKLNWPLQGFRFRRFSGIRPNGVSWQPEYEQLQATTRIPKWLWMPAHMDTLRVSMNAGQIAREADGGLTALLCSPR